jgi:methionyl-tRNA synthetase
VICKHEWLIDFYSDQFSPAGEFTCVKCGARGDHCTRCQFVVDFDDAIEPCRHCLSTGVTELRQLLQPTEDES